MLSLLLVLLQRCLLSCPFVGCRYAGCKVVFLGEILEWIEQLMKCAKWQYTMNRCISLSHMMLFEKIILVNIHRCCTPLPIILKIVEERHLTFHFVVNLDFTNSSIFPSITVQEANSFMPSKYNAVYRPGLFINAFLNCFIIKSTRCVCVSRLRLVNLFAVPTNAFVLLTSQPTALRLRNCCVQLWTVCLRRTGCWASDDRAPC